ncbi:hypothetical protein FAF44_49340 [Nonomuraea sp. MG754425]|uniref:WXG100-like domain-containing protein n=1 Tax=Nonomuraea sp. MG754425 TaxID=2570319 RepID=UPI001F20F3DB|nr:hypothetical protein [Nonomuraea sp. MG754425]MCF6476294.1 hypothetical protein [Nonomuraea sp. MG754425]
MDWPEADEAVLFRLADDLALAFYRINRGVRGDGRLAGGAAAGDERGDWDGEALRRFVERVGHETAGRRQELLSSLAGLALACNDLGVQVQYTKRMIKLSVLLLIVQLSWLLWAMLSPASGVAWAAAGTRAQATRMTIRQLAKRLLSNAALFGTLMGGMDLYVQATQSRRAEIDWDQVGWSALSGALTGAVLTLSTGLLPPRSVLGLIGHSATAGGATTLATMLVSAQPIDWEMVAKGTTAGAFGGADAHWASWSPQSGRAGGGEPQPSADDPSTPPRALRRTEPSPPSRAREGGPTPAPSPRPDPTDPAARAALEKSTPRGVNGPPEHPTGLAAGRSEFTADRVSPTGGIDQMINWGRSADEGESTSAVQLRRQDAPVPRLGQGPAAHPADPLATRHRDSPAEPTLARIRDSDPSAEVPAARTRQPGHGRLADASGSRTREADGTQMRQAQEGLREPARVGAAEHSTGSPGPISETPAHHFGQNGERPATITPESAPSQPERPPQAPAPELTARQQELIRQSRREVTAGIWYRDPSRQVMPTVDLRLLRPTDGIIDVGIAGDGAHFLIGDQRLTAKDLGTMLAHDPRVLSHPDATLRVLGHGTVVNRGLLQELANVTGREVTASDRPAYIGADRQPHTATVQGLTPDGHSIFQGRDDGAWHTAMPDSRVLPPERPAQVPASWPEPARGLSADAVQAAAAADESQWRALGAGDDGLVDLLTLNDDTSVLRKIMDRDIRQVDIELMVAQVAKSLGARVADIKPYPGRPDAVLMEYVPGRPAVGPDVRFLPGAVLIELLDVLVVNHDRFGNLQLTADGLVGFDHGKSFDLKLLDLGEHEHLVLRGNFLGRRPDGTFGWIDNPLTRQDVELITERLHGLRAEFARHGMPREYDVMMDRLYQVAEHASGDTPLIAPESGPASRIERPFGHGEGGSDRVPHQVARYLDDLSQSPEHLNELSERIDDLPPAADRLRDEVLLQEQHDAWFDDSQNRKVIAAGEELVGSLQWRGPSGPDENAGWGLRRETAWGYAHDFFRWLLGEGPEPTAWSTMNCWEALMFTAYRAGVVDKRWLDQVYQHASLDARIADLTGNRAYAFDVFARWVTYSLAPGLRLPYVIDPATGIGVTDIPRGFVIFVDDIAHAMLSLGTRDTHGRQEVLSHWVYPERANMHLPEGFQWGFMQRTTVEELLATDVFKQGRVEFGKPIWLYKDALGR